MNRIIFSIFILSVFAFTAFSQSDETLITIGKTKVSKGEFERIYQKNNNNLYNEAEKKTPEEYLDLFINFKLKVIEAEDLKMDTSSVFIHELAGYREELAAPYLTDVKYDEQMVRDLYERTTKEVNASHLLLTVPQNASPEQDAAVLNRIEKIRKEIIDGKDFNEAAVEYSEDPSAKVNKGSLGYFSAFQMVVPFENAAFTTPVGEVSQPIRTSFGYHLLKVHDIRENQGEILVAHIMKMFPKDITPEIKIVLKIQIDSIYNELKNGADFAELAQKTSDDKRSAVQGGEMAWFSSGRMIPEFANAAFALKNVGDISKPIETPYGFHIIKKLNTRPVASFEASKASLETRIKQDPERSITSKKIFIDKLKTQYNYSENQEAKNKLYNKNSNDTLDFANSELFKIDNKSYTVDQFQKYLKENHSEPVSFLTQFDTWIEHEITALENSKLEMKYPEFRYLVQEYHDGILLFNISEEKIWNFASQDTTGLEEYYSKNKNKYLWEERFKGLVVTCKNDSAREEADKFFAAEMTVAEITDMLNAKENLISISEGAWEKGANPVVDYYVWNGPKPANFNSELSFIRGDKIPPEAKTLEEARGLYVSDYQKYLEDKWIKELRAKYKITVDKKLLKSINGV
ncbi:MAG TPA: peptidylprolyl isomerase [Draconibacterium sp.]|nr:peptidylprolyl isomerase [Draconibacterium sp.]